MALSHMIRNIFPVGIRYNLSHLAWLYQISYIRSSLQVLHSIYHTTVSHIKCKHCKKCLHKQTKCVITKTKQSQDIKTMKRFNNLIEALSLPSLWNMNRRSFYSKIDEFHEFVEHFEIDKFFMSKLWERKSKILAEKINLEDYQMLSNVPQRKGQGGRPAIVVNRRKY